MPFTRFDTDARDKQNGVWDKVFGNFSDFGEAFAAERRSTPNAFGPIALFIRPDALSLAADVAVSLRSAGERGFNRELEALGSAAEVERLFGDPLPGEPPRDGMMSILDLFVDHSRLKYRTALEKEFPGRKVKTPELHCTIPEGVLPSKYIEHIIIDPYRVAGRCLRDIVEELVRRFELQVAVKERRARPGRAPLYQELWALCSEDSRSLSVIASSSTVSEELRNWVRQLLASDAGEQALMFDRYNRYLRNGTINTIETHPTSR